MNPAHLFLICIAYWVVFGLGFACRHSLDDHTGDESATFMVVVVGLVCSAAFAAAFAATIASLIQLVASAL